MKTTLLAAGLVLAAGAAHAGTTTYTGADLLSAATFPSVAPVLDGTALLFDTDQQAFLTLLRLPLGPLPDGRVRIVLDLTRPACVDPGCIGGVGDFDPNFGISDGSQVVGGLIADNVGGQGFQAAYLDQGGLAPRIQAVPVFNYAGFPAIGERVEVTLEAEVRGDGTAIDLSFLGGSAAFTGASLAGTDGLEFLLVRDNDAGERYQVNAITVETADTTRTVAVDIKPGSCVNPFNAGSRGVLPVALTGGAGLDVAQVDPASITLAGVPALRWSHGDSSGADCASAGDGVLDLLLKFDSEAVAAALTGVPDGERIDLLLEGRLLDGTALAGSDTVRVIRPARSGRP